MSVPDGLVRRIVGISSAVLSVFVVSACQVDLSTTVNIAENGSGTITVVATADAAAVRAAPELATSLNVDDLVAAGWTVETQSPSTDGGLTIVLQHAFAQPDEATVLLSQLSGDRGPLRAVTLTRTGNLNDAAYQFSGVGGLPDGLAGFADAEALAALGGAPFAAALAQSGGALSDVLTISFALTMPGEPLDTTAAITPRQADDASTTFTWSIPLDATENMLEATTRDRDVSAMVAWYGARILLLILVLLVVCAVVYIATVVYRRTRPTPAS